MNMEARRWTHLPTDANIVGIATVHTNIDIALDPVFHIEEGTAEADTIMASYLHSFGFLGKTARLDVRVPYQSIQWKGALDGVQRKINREGLGDPLIRLSVNFMGAPALQGDAFRSYRSTHKTNTVVGAALGVVVPLGQYKIAASAYDDIGKLDWIPTACVFNVEASDFFEAPFVPPIRYSTALVDHSWKLMLNTD